MGVNFDVVITGTVMVKALSFIDKLGTLEEFMGKLNPLEQEMVRVWRDEFKEITALMEDLEDIFK